MINAQFSSACSDSTTERESHVIASLRFIFGYVVVVNLPFWTASHLTDTYPRGWFNIEYIMVGILGLFVGIWPTAALLVLVLLADVFHTSASFYFFSQQDLIASARFVLALPLARTIPIAFALFGFAAFWTYVTLKVVPRMPRTQRNALAVYFIFIPFLFLTVDVINGSNGLLRIRDSRASYKLASANVVSLARATYLLMWGHDDTDFRAVPSASEHFVFVPEKRDGAAVSKEVTRTGVNGPNITLIVFESLGLIKDPRDQQLLNSVFETPEIRSTYNVQYSKVAFNGASVAGEFRELCGIWAGILRQPAPEVLRSKCLPSSLTSEGYDTTAFHGFNSYLFNRDVIYPQLGFSHIFFREQLLATGLVRDCKGAFVGVCDSDIAAMIRRTLEDPNVVKPKFVYWLTLDSHLPISRSRMVSSLCLSADDSFRDPDLCGWLNVVHSTLSEIAALAADPTLPPTEFVVVGDHAPPFIFQTARAQFDSHYVPVIHLVPKIHERHPAQLQMTEAPKVQAVKADNPSD
jgi:hypothetical protein